MNEIAARVKYSVEKEAMLRATFLSCVLMSVGVQLLGAQCPASFNVNAPETIAWTGKLLTALASESSCSGISSDDQFASTSACNIFVGRVLETVYGVTDFETNDPSQPYMLANDIGALLQTGTLTNWTLLGTADSADNNFAAKTAADAGKLVLAVYEVPGHTSPGHVALIGPGPLKPSSSWGMSVPVSASYFLGKPAKAYLGQPLSCAFQKNINGNVKIWVKG